MKHQVLNRSEVTVRRLPNGEFIAEPCALTTLGKSIPKSSVDHWIDAESPCECHRKFRNLWVPTSWSPDHILKIYGMIQGTAHHVPVFKNQQSITEPFRPIDPDLSSKATIEVLIDEQSTDLIALMAKINTLRASNERIQNRSDKMVLDCVELRKVVQKQSAAMSQISSKDQEIQKLTSAYQNLQHRFNEQVEQGVDLKKANSVLKRKVKEQEKQLSELRVHTKALERRVAQGIKVREACSVVTQTTYDIAMRSCISTQTMGVKGLPDSVNIQTLEISGLAYARPVLASKIEDKDMFSGTQSSDLTPSQILPSTQLIPIRYKAQSPVVGAVNHDHKQQSSGPSSDDLALIDTNLMAIQDQGLFNKGVGIQDRAYMRRSDTDSALSDVSSVSVSIQAKPCMNAVSSQTDEQGLMLLSDYDKIKYRSEEVIKQLSKLNRKCVLHMNMRLDELIGERGLKISPQELQNIATCLLESSYMSYSEYLSLFKQQSCALSAKWNPAPDK